MFGPKKSTKKAAKEPAPAPVPVGPETPDLVVEMPQQNAPQTVGMPGFTSDQPTQTMPEKTETGIPGFGSVGAPLPQTPVQEEQATVAAAVAAPAQVPIPAPAPVAPAPAAPAPVVKEQYQVLAAEMVGEGLYQYVIRTNKNLGEVGGVYEA